MEENDDWMWNPVEVDFRRFMDFLKSRGYQVCERSRVVREIFEYSPEGEQTVTTVPSGLALRGVKQDRLYAEWLKHGGFGSPYDEKFGDDRLCVCGHVYYRHFDSYEGMFPIGCKYCQCRRFEEYKPENCTDCGSEKAEHVGSTRCEVSSEVHMWAKCSGCYGRNPAVECNCQDPQNEIRA